MPTLSFWFRPTIPRLLWPRNSLTQFFLGSGGGGGYRRLSYFGMTDMGATMGAAKVAVSIPPSLFEAAEAERRRTGETRSELVQRAVELLLARRRLEEDERRYIEGYRKYPETDEEVEIINAAGLAVLATQPWD
jgi:Arc/MetJ-type ribon-helix-helix transcriptional regulator